MFSKAKFEVIYISKFIKSDENYKMIKLIRC